MSAKLLTFEDAPAVMDSLRDAGKCIVQCHGTFDLIHPGHIVHFEEARDQGDVLVVTVTGETHVNKGPGRPFFNDSLRVRSIAALACVDYVIVIPFPAAVEAIECVKPNVYCKGKEYSDPQSDVTGEMSNDVRAVHNCGGKIVHVGSVVFSSTKLLNQNFDTYSDEVKQFARDVAETCSRDEFRTLVNDFSSLKVLVVGDLIFDRYTSVAVQGLTSKNRILSGRFVDDSLQPGGALAVFRHIQEFTDNVTLVGMCGTEAWANDEIKKYIPDSRDGVVRSDVVTTITKQRFVEPQVSGKELSKLFSVNYIDADHPPKSVRDELLKRISQHIDNVDIVVAMDFGHGVMAEDVRELVQDRAKFLALNCQTNSNNHGYNVINRQYQRADSFSLDQAEIHLAAGKRYMNYEDELENLSQTLSSRYAWLTRGSVETIGMHRESPPCVCPPLETSIVDSIGAGDAFCAIASLAAAAELPLPLATFMGQLAGAIAVRIIGNTDPVRKGKFIKGGQTMLSF